MLHQERISINSDRTISQQEMTIYLRLQFLLISPDYLSMLAHSSFMLYLLVFTTSISYPSGNQSRHFQLYQTYLQSFLPPSKCSFARYNFSSKPYWLLSLIIRTPSISVVFLFGVAVYLPTTGQEAWSSLETVHWKLASRFSWSSDTDEMRGCTLSLVIRLFHPWVPLKLLGEYHLDLAIC